MSDVMSQFVFIDPPKTALNKEEFNAIVEHRRAFNIVQTAELNPIWKTEADLLAITEANSTQLYVLYKFSGDAYAHLVQLKCRIIGPLVVMISHADGLDFPMKPIPIWEPEKQPPVAPLRYQNSATLSSRQVISNSLRSEGISGSRRMGTPSSRKGTPSSRQRTEASDNTSIISRPRSPEYVSQGPVMSVRTTSNNTSHAVFWDDRFEKSTKAVPANTHPPEGLSQFISNEVSADIQEDDIFMDDDERELLAQLNGRIL